MATRSPEVDAYLAALPEASAGFAAAVRDALHAGLPDGQETIRYGMPAIMLGPRYAIHFAAWKAHVGLYPVPTLGEPLDTEVAALRSGKDTVVLKYRDPVPTALITRVAGRILALRG